MVEIRTGRPADGPRLREIQAAAIAEPWPALLDTALTGPPPLYVVVDSSDEPLGYGIVIPDSESVAYLPELAVDPNRQGEGYGSKLVDAICDSLEDDGYEQLRLTVRAVDEQAREFYRENDFETRERLPDHFEDCDGFLLERTLE